MGEALYAQLGKDRPDIACRTYAPVGSHRDLLAYLVRRLLENGANSSFVALAADEAVPVRRCCGARPKSSARPTTRGIRNIPLPRDLYRPQRQNSRGVEFGERAALEQARLGDRRARPARRRKPSPMQQPEQANAAIAAARAGFQGLEPNAGATRAAMLEQAADLLEQRAAHFIALLQREGGKTLDDASPRCARPPISAAIMPRRAEICSATARPCRARPARAMCCVLRGRGVFVAISPWNFPLAIFLGQVTAALMAGNTVVAKPAEQTPLIAAEAVRLLHEAGVPASALHLVQGDGRIGAALVAHPEIAGVVFTGSTEVARSINRTLAAKDGPIVPLIAETGGINAMIVDATALPEQVADDVVTSAFRSAGQRCSALRLLFVQDDVADRMIEMVAGAARELRIGDPTDPATHVGPVIDTEAKQRLDAHIARMMKEARVHFAGTAPEGNFVAPHIFELSDAGLLTEEVFGPILHVVRYRADRLDHVLRSIERSGYGLTLGIHSRIDDTIEDVVDRLQVGNIYINRNMIGAVVGVQPFGGHGLSGTGPKAGGPHYLARFATEQTVTINTAAAGGNAALMAGGE